MPTVQVIDQILKGHTMNTHADKTQEHTSVTASSAKEQSSGESTLQFVDNKPEAAAQRKLQAMANNSPKAKQTAQLQTMADNYSAKQQQPVQKKGNNTGLPDNLKSGIEKLSGHSMDDVKVHYNSNKPAQLNAHAYAQGNKIHVGPGQEKHLGHEAWHVVQQKQGRVQPTKQLKGKVNINDDEGLEKEADIMGAKATQMKSFLHSYQIHPIQRISYYSSTAQLEEIESTAAITTNMAWGLIKSVLAKEMANAKWTSIIGPLLHAGDTLIASKVSVWTGLSKLVPGINYVIIAAKAALAVWDTIPDNIKTGILYVMGMLTANAPVIGRYQSLQDLIVKGDQGEVRESVEGWVNAAKTAVFYFTQPLTSLYQYLTGSSETEIPTPESKDSESETPSKAETEKLINLNLQVITLMINNLKLGYDTKTPEQEPEQSQTSTKESEKKDAGLIVEFFVQLHLFNKNLPERKGKTMDQLFFPFSGEFKYKAGSPIVINSSDKTILGNTLGPVNIFPLEVTKSGVKNAGLNIDKLIVGNGIVILTSAKGTIKNKIVSLSTDAAVNIAGHSISGSMDLQLNDGHFKSLALKKVNDEGNYKLKKFEIDKSFNGSTDIEIEKLELLKKTLSATNVKAVAAVSNKKLTNFDFTLEEFLMDFWGSTVDIKGAHLSYTGSNPEKNIEENISGGATEIDANIKGVNLNLKGLEIDKKAGKYEFSRGSVKFKDFDITVEKAAMKNGGIEIIRATLSVPKYNISGSVNSFTWNSEGLDFESLQLALPGKTISPIDQVHLSNMSLEILKTGGYKLILTSDVEVSPNGGTSLLGAKAAQLTMSREEIAGTLAQLDINTSLFNVLIKEAEFNKNRVGAKEAGISFKSKEEGTGYSKMLPSFDTGLLDFINLDTGLKVKDAYFNKGKGFSIGSVQPALKAFTINLFGVKATVDPEDRSITIKSDFTFPGNVPPIWPFSMSVPFPIFIGVAGHFGLELNGGVTLDFDSKIQREKGKDKPYKFNAKPGIAGQLNLKISAGAEFGARLAVALQANLYAQAGLKINTKADLSGAVKYTDGKLEQTDPLKMLYELKSIVTAEVGGELKVKAFLFYDKQLTKVKFKDWTLGEWSKSGQFGSSPEGDRIEDKNKGEFGSPVTGPTVDSEIVEGEKAKELLLSTHERIIGSGAKRKELITQLTVDVSKLASELLTKQQKLKREFDTSMNELMKIILRKDAFFREHYKSPDIEGSLSKFDSKNKLDEKRDYIRQKGGILDDYEAELNKILGLMNNVESGLDVVGLESGVGNKVENIESQKTKADTIKEGITGLTAPEIESEALNSELTEMGADALSVEVSSSVMTKDKFIEISTTSGLLGGENERKRVKEVDDALKAYDQVRTKSKEVQIPILENLLEKVKTYISVRFSSRTQAALLLQYQVEQALSKLKRG